MLALCLRHPAIRTISNSLSAAEQLASGRRPSPSPFISSGALPQKALIMADFCHLPAGKGSPVLRSWHLDANVCLGLRMRISKYVCVYNVCVCMCMFLCMSFFKVYYRIIMQCIWASLVRKEVLIALSKHELFLISANPFQQRQEPCNHSLFWYPCKARAFIITILTKDKN